MFKQLAVEIGRNIAAPVGRRVAAVVAAYLVAQEIPQELANQFVLALGVVGGLVLEIAASYVTKRRA